MPAGTSTSGGTSIVLPRRGRVINLAGPLNDPFGGGQDGGGGGHHGPGTPFGIRNQRVAPHACSAWRNETHGFSYCPYNGRPRYETFRYSGGGGPGRRSIALFAFCTLSTFLVLFLFLVGRRRSSRVPPFFHHR